MAKGRLPRVTNAQELEALVLDIGFLPLVDGAVPGFSVESCTPRALWFVRGVEGPWEWREMLADSGRVVYAKLFRGKTGFASPLWYADFANYRRGGMDFAERYENGLIPRREKQVMDLLRQNGPMLSRDLKAVVGTKGFDSTMASLQMRTDVVMQRFEYRRNAQGQAYGPGTTRFAPAEAVVDELLLYARFAEPPEASYARLAGQVAALYPEASETDIYKLLKL